MAWTYGDYGNATTYSTAAARLARLNLHIQEVSDLIMANVSADGKSRDSSSLNDYLRYLEGRRIDLEQQSQVAVSGGLMQLRFPGRT